MGPRAVTFKCCRTSHSWQPCFISKRRLAILCGQLQKGLDSNPALYSYMIVVWMSILRYARHIFRAARSIYGRRWVRLNMSIDSRCSYLTGKKTYLYSVQQVRSRCMSFVRIILLNLALAWIPLGMLRGGYVPAKGSAKEERKSRDLPGSNTHIAGATSPT